jgi:hypothetical protein
LRNFHIEDMEMLTATQRGIATSSYLPGRLSHLEKPTWLFQRYLARQIANHYPEAASAGHADRAA